VSDDTAIYVDAGVPATLNDGAGAQTDSRTLQEAVLAWLALPTGGNARFAKKLQTP
jgi:hypothetical protein